VQRSFKSLQTCRSFLSVTSSCKPAKCLSSRLYFSAPFPSFAGISTPDCGRSNGQAINRKLKPAFWKQKSVNRKPKPVNRKLKPVNRKPKESETKTPELATTAELKLKQVNRKLNQLNQSEWATCLFQSQREDGGNILFEIMARGDGGIDPICG